MRGCINMTIICDRCKAEYNECPECGGRISSNLWVSIVAIIVAFICLGISIVRWQGSLIEYDRAMNLRRTYLKKSNSNVPDTGYNRNQ